MKSGVQHAPRYLPLKGTLKRGGRLALNSFWEGQMGGASPYSAHLAAVDWTLTREHFPRREAGANAIDLALTAGRIARGRHALS